MDSTALSFPQFDQLPTEIRFCVWEFAVPEDVPEVFILGSVLDGTGSDNKDAAPVGSDPIRKVLIGFPTILHICHESRYVARAILSFLSVETSRSYSIQIPCRLYRPDLDAIFVPQLSFVDFMTASPTTEDQLLRQIRHIAFSSSEIYRIYDGIDHFRILARCTALEQISFIFSKPEDTIDITEDWSHNRQLRHFTLDEWTEAEGQLIHATGDTSVLIQPALEHVQTDLSFLDVEDGSPQGEQTKKCLFKVDAKRLAVQPPRWRL